MREKVLATAIVVVVTSASTAYHTATQQTADFLPPPSPFYYLRQVRFAQAFQVIHYFFSTLFSPFSQEEQCAIIQS